MAAEQKPKNEYEWMVARYAPHVEKRLPCFHCGKPIEGYPVVGWDGTGKDGKRLEVVMHQPCANELVLRLAHDVFEAGRLVAPIRG